MKFLFLLMLINTAFAESTSPNRPPLEIVQKAKSEEARIRAEEKKKLEKFHQDQGEESKAKALKK